MRATRRDANHAELMAYLQTCGWHVIDTSAVGPNAVPGFPDVLACSGGIVIGVEFKVGDAGLTDDEARFHAGHGYALPIEVVRNLDDVLNVTRKYMVGRLGA